MSHFPHSHRRRDDDSFPEPHPPMTQEQLEFFTEQQQVAVERALKRYSRKALIGFLALFVGFLFNALNNQRQDRQADEASTAAREAIIDSGNLVAVNGCNRDFEDRVAMRGVLLASKSFTDQAVAEGRLTEYEGERRIAFYDERLRELPLPDCRDTRNLITDDPDVHIIVPEPLYPESAESIVPPVSAQGKGRP